MLSFICEIEINLQLMYTYYTCVAYIQYTVYMYVYVYQEECAQYVQLF